MDLELSDDQRLLKDMVERFAIDTGGLDAHRAAVRSEHGWSTDMWRQMAELGLVAIPVSEDAGGLGGGGVELMIVGEAFGRHLVDSPFLETAVIGGTILSGVESAARGDVLKPVIDGSVTVALIERGMTGHVDGLTGTARAVIGGGGADLFIVAAHDKVFLVDAGATGVMRDDYALHGGGRAADIRFDNVRATVLGGENVAGPLLVRAQAARTVYLAAEALGLAEQAFALTIEYLKTRVQFGKPIGVNQSLQHRSAEMFVEIEQMRSAAILAACSLDERNVDDRTRIMAGVSMVIAKAARFIAQQAVQLHGGIGVTEEHAVGHQFLRLTAIALLLNGDAQTRLLADLGGFVVATPWGNATV